MTDLELLELAAKAAGVPNHELYDTIGDHGGVEKHGWNPLTDDGDALRLAVALDISLRLDGDELTGIAHWRRNGKTNRLVGSYRTGSADEARRLIVRAAAEIGRAMP